MGPTHQNRYTHQLYHPYYPVAPVPTYMKSCSYDDNATTISFNHSGLYESESEESFPGSPFSTEDLNTIDFSDLFNIQKHEQDDLTQNNQILSLLDQVRREQPAPLESIGCYYDLSPAHTPENNYTIIKEEPYPSPPTCYTQLQPALPPSPPQTYNKNYLINVKTEKPKPPRRSGSHSSDDNNDKIRLYEFVLQLLNEERNDCIRWLCPVEGEFEITNSARIAQLWGGVKKNPTMTYEKFARALRHYYKLGILVNYKHKEKLRYKFSQDILLKNKKSLENNSE